MDKEQKTWRFHDSHFLLFSLLRSLRLRWLTVHTCDITMGAIEYKIVTMETEIFSLLFSL